MAIIQDPVTSSQQLRIDAGGAAQTVAALPQVPSAGGFYTVCGGTSAVVAASLGANTPLMTMRFSASSTRKAYVTRMRCKFYVATVGTSALVAGAMGLQRFTTATPSGGTARTANREDENNGSATDMTDIRDSNAALTVTSVVFGNVVAWDGIPLFISGGAMWSDWVFEPPYPVVLQPGDGLSLRTQVACPGTQTWQFGYTFHWYEA